MRKLQVKYWMIWSIPNDQFSIPIKFLSTAIIIPACICTAAIEPIISDREFAFCDEPMHISRECQ